MLGNLKVNSSDAGNILMSLKQADDSTGLKPTGADFYSMVMNSTNGTELKDDKDNSFKDSKGTENRVSATETASAKNINDKSGAEESVEFRRNDSSSSVSEKKQTLHDDKTSQEKITEGEDKLSVKKGEAHFREKDKKTEHDAKGGNRTGLDEFISSAAGELLSKRIAELAKLTDKGAKEDFAAKFRKVADEFLSSGKKKLSPGNEFNFSMAGERGGVQKDNSAPALTDFFNRLGQELSKIVSAKKGDEKRPLFTEKEVKETIGAIIEDIKKGKNRIQDKAELKRAEPDEIRNERKNETAADTLVMKKRDVSSDSGSDLNPGKERNSSREGNSFASAKFDAAGRNSFEKNDAIMKSPEFRQSLQEIIDKAKVSVRDSSNATFSVRLFPKDLGSVNVNLLMENGVVSGRFLVDSDEARNLLLGNLGTLKEQLAEAGIQVGEFNVNVNQGGERFAAKEKEDERTAAAHQARSESEAAANQYDYNSSAAHNGRINMVI